MHLVPGLRGYEVAVEVVLVSELVVLLVLHRTDVGQVVLVGHQHHVRHGLLEEGPLHKEQPVLEVLEALVVREVVRQDDRVGPVDVVAHHLAANGLTTNVPNLHTNVHIPWKHHPLYEKVEAYRLLVMLCEVVLAEARRKGCLADSTITEQNDFVLQVFGLIFVILIPQLGPELGHRPQPPVLLVRAGWADHRLWRGRGGKRPHNPLSYYCSGHGLAGA
mmetsp:Transcript_100219/g.283771  ORF Transcript_100219/g.283771 Transcript_100219/m.283771 type:complete len:219 (-) Transcript_100219:7-663(-)